jgi:hypothetical protein
LRACPWPRLPTCPVGHFPGAVGADVQLAAADEGIRSRVAGRERPYRAVVLPVPCPVRVGGPDCLLRRVRRPPAEAARGFVVLARGMRRGLAAGVRVEDDAVTAQLGNCSHEVMVQRPPAVRTWFSRHRHVREGHGIRWGRDGRDDFGELSAHVVHPNPPVGVDEPAPWRRGMLSEAVEAPAAGGITPRVLATVVLPAADHLVAFALDGEATSHLVAEAAVSVLEPLAADRRRRGRGNPAVRYGRGSGGIL